MMTKLTLGNIEKSLGVSRTVDHNIHIANVTIDSRHVESGSLFVALSGNRVDGHDFIEAARTSGAAAALVEDLQSSELPQIQVDNTAVALGAVGRLNREAFDGSVVALTGSAGKTTCKNMLASILSERFSVCSTQGNLNNELGVPLTLTSITDEHDVAVIEMGAAQQGDIAYLVSLAKPRVAILTNVAEAHIGRFGDLETTARTKGEIFSQLGSDDLAVINADDAFAKYWRETIEQRNQSIRIKEFSINDPSASAYATDIISCAGGQQFTLNYHQPHGVEKTSIRLQLSGLHNVANALAATIAALDLGCSLNDVAQGLAKVQAAKGRLQLRQGRNELTFIDDTYNANPQAMEAAIEVSEELAGGRLRLIVLGDMAELGGYARQRHEAVGRYVAKSQQATTSLAGFFVLGEYAQAYEQGYRTGLGDCTDDVFKRFSSKQEIAETLLDKSYRGMLVLVKGSRSAAMEDIVDELCADDTAGEQ